MAADDHRTTRRALIAAAAVAVTAACNKDAEPWSTKSRASEASASRASASSAASGQSASGQPSSASPTTQQTSEQVTIADGLDTPWSIAWLPDGNALVSERDTAKVWLLSRDGDTWQKSPAGIVPGVKHGGEGGLLGLVAHPTRENHVFAYRTTDDGNRVDLFARQRAQWSTAGTVVEGIPAAGNHNGGRMALSPDGHLIIATGDAAQRDLAQDEKSLAGKILRVDLTGKPVADNPDPKSPVLSLGHRNVQGLAWSDDGRMWASEFGPEVDDELNLIERGKNYGWPTVTGTETAEGSAPAVHRWPSTADASPSAIAIKGNLCWVACLRGTHVARLELPAAGQEFEAGGTLPSSTVLEGVRYRDVTLTPGGQHLWVLTNAGDRSQIVQVPAV